MPTTEPEFGCYGDGTHGHQYTRKRCAAVIEYYLDANFTARGIKVHFDTTSLVDSLKGPMPDDAWDELEACDWLNAWAPYTYATWGWRDDDFGLWANEEGE
jgi:hypothetical protein